MNKQFLKIIKFSIIVFLLFILFFILFDIQKEESIKQEATAERLNTEKEIQLTEENSEITENKEKNDKKQSTDNTQNVEKEFIETEYKGYDVCAKLIIPKINLETYVLKNYSSKALLVSVTKFFGSQANKTGNFCIAGHNYGPNNMFQNLKDLEVNDEIYLIDLDGIKMKYTVYDIYKVLPNETDCLSQKTNGNIELTLITCTLDSEKRIIIKAIAN